MLGSSRAPTSSPLVDPTARRVGDLLNRSLVSCRVGASIQEAARQMAAGQRDALVVLELNGDPVGMVTDTDLRRVLAEGLPFATRVEAVMGAPLVTVDAEAFYFEALHAMLRHRLHHLLVLEGGRPIGVLADVDLLAARTQGPLWVARRIEAARSLDDLADLGAARQAAVRLLQRSGLRAQEIARITAETNDQLVRKVLDLVERELGPPPLPYCWLGLGSEGRREQTLKTDQDNALVYHDPPPGQEQATAEYFAALAERAVAALEGSGFPRCPGGVNASNPLWCQPLRAWRSYFGHWVSRPEERAILNSAIFFDLRAVAGDSSLAEALWSDLREWLPRAPLLLKLLLREALQHRPPLRFLRGFVVEHSGEHRGGFDLKWSGLMPVVEPARVFALARGVSETNTVERLRTLRELGELNERDSEDLVAAYDFIMGLRIRHHLDQLAAGQEPDDFVAPDHLPRVEASTLREHFKVVAQLQGYIESQLQVGLGS